MQRTERKNISYSSQALSLLVVLSSFLSFQYSKAAKLHAASGVNSTDSGIRLESMSLYVCEGGHAQTRLQDLSDQGVEYEWSPVVGIEQPYAANPIIRPIKDCVFTRKSWHLGNTVGYDTIQVYVRNRDAVVFAAIDSVCEGIPVIYGIVPDQSEEQRFLWNASTATGTVLGQIVSGQETNIITVMWAGQGSGRIQLRIDYPQSGCAAQGHSVVDVKAINQPLILPSSLVVCPNNNVVLRTDGSYSGYMWSTGETSQSIEVTKPGVYSVVAFGSNGCSKRSETVMIRQSSIVKPVIEGTSDVCPGTSARLILSNGYDSYLWSTGERSREINAVAGTYRVSVWSADGCSAISDAVTIHETSNHIRCSVEADREVVKNGRLSGEFTFTNVSSADVILNSVVTTTLSPAHVDLGVGDFPFRIAAGASVRLNYSREPIPESRVLIPLVVHQSAPCARVDTLDVEFIKAVEPPRVRVSAGDVVLVQCGSAFELPIRVDLDDAAQERCANAQLHVQLSWDESVFCVTGLNNIESMTQVTGPRSSGVALTFPSLSTVHVQTMPFSLRAMALAGGHQQSVVSIDSAWWTNSSEEVSITLSNGSVTLKQHCFPSPISLGEPTKESLRMYPNPASTTCRAVVMPTTDGIYRLTVLSPTGQKAGEWSVDAKHGVSFESEFDTERLCDGLYTLIVRSDAEQHFELFGVVH